MTVSSLSVVLHFPNDRDRGLVSEDDAIPDNAPGKRLIRVVATHTCESDRENWTRKTKKRL